MQKGTPENKRDSRWHHKHKKKLAKAKKRHKRGNVIRDRISLSRAERQFQESQARERQRRSPSLLIRLGLWFISTKPVVLIRKFINWYHERQNKG